ncbi:hypothetical protein OH768_36435 [Streptomyces sp. NBC_01622]|uniref:hypothetical protein n=1 Tax=Streptomyces sp. NBC_01622 TaxID=2975903 RepID=UPI0038641D29|nr:hypothetical protein OH768_36435 [Streptomyces sp. NBC_01622]
MTDVTRPNGDTTDERKGADTGMGTGTERGTGIDRREPAKTAGQQQGPAKTAERREATTVTPTPRQGDRLADKTAPRERDETARGDQQAQSTRPVHAPEPPPTSSAADKRHDRLDTGNGSLLPHDESDKFNLRLQHAVTGFVDEPRAAVEEAAHVLEEVADRLTQAVTRRRDTLNSSWESKGSDDTEQLRLALRDYRELTERLLHI